MCGVSECVCDVWCEYGMCVVFVCVWCECGVCMCGVWYECVCGVRCVSVVCGVV